MSDGGRPGHRGLHRLSPDPPGLAPHGYSFAWLVVCTVVGAGIGVAVVLMLLSWDLGEIVTGLKATQLLLAAFCGFGVAVLIGVPAGYWFLRRFIGTAEGALVQVIADATAAAEAASARNAQSAVEHAGRALREAAAWYAPRAARRFVVTTTLGLIVTFGGLTGTALLLRQTLLLGIQNELLVDQNRKIDRQVELLTAQNDKIDLQTVTVEAQRRGGLASELFSILQAATSLKEGEPLGRPLTARIVTFSRATEAYFTIVVPQDGKPPYRADRAFSPERGQLLAGLAIAKVNISSLIQEGAVFAGAVAVGANLRDAPLSKADLRGATLSKADLINANLSDANLINANLSYADLINANLINANLSDANLSDADLSGANLSKADLRGATLRGATLSGANLSRAINLTQAQLDAACGRLASLPAGPPGLTLDKSCPTAPTGGGVAPAL